MKEGLNPKQELFCQLYSTSEEFFGNGLRAYMKAYDIKPERWKSALSASSRLLTNGSIMDRVNELLELRGLNNAFVDKQLEFLITQHADFKSKMAAIREYNKLKQRITERTDITSGGEKIGSVATDVLALAETELRKRRTNG